MLESASKDATTDDIKFTKPIRGSATGSDPVTIKASKWIIDPAYKDELTTAPKNLSLNSAGGLVPVFDTTAKARFICEHTPFSSSGTPLKFEQQAVKKPLERSLLSFNPNV